MPMERKRNICQVTRIAPPVCLIVQPIHSAGIQRLQDQGLQPVTDGVAVDPSHVVAVITRNAGFSAARMEALPCLRVIAVHGVGYDPVDVEAATRSGIAITNTPGANERSVAEQAIALLFALAKQVVGADAAVRAGDFGFKYSADLVELAGLTMGLAGFGPIGQQTAALGRALGMRVVACSRYQPDAVFERLGVDRLPTLEAVLRASDAVSLHMPANDATRNAIGRTQLALMKPTAFLINTGRGDTVDEEALVNALKTGKIRGAGLDVFRCEPLTADHPLRSLKNVVLSPHVAGSTEASLQRTAVAAADCALSVLAGQRPDTLVNASVWPSRRLPQQQI